LIVLLNFPGDLSNDIFNRILKICEPELFIKAVDSAI